MDREEESLKSSCFDFADSDSFWETEEEEEEETS